MKYPNRFGWYKNNVFWLGQISVAFYSDRKTSHWSEPLGVKIQYQFKTIFCFFKR